MFTLASGVYTDHTISQKNGIHEWTPFRDVLLNEIMRHEGNTSQQVCVVCMADLDTPVRCTECFSIDCYCIECICDAHKSNPLHIVEVSIVFARSLQLPTSDRTCIIELERMLLDSYITICHQRRLHIHAQPHRHDLSCAVLIFEHNHSHLIIRDTTCSRELLWV